MSAIVSYRMLITPLSPVHIGTGESYEPTNYVIEDGVLHEFDTGSVIDALSSGDRKALLEIGNRRPDSAMILAARKFFFDRRELLMPWAIQRIPVAGYVSDLYKERIARAAQVDKSGAKVLNELAIDRTGYNPATRLPVLFGSSLKGAIRTALLDKANSGKPATEKKGLHEFQGRIFKYLNDHGKPVLELDPMRLVQLSDAVWQGEPGLPAVQVHLAVNRKKLEVKDKQGKVRKSQAETKELYQVLECVSGWRYRAFAGQINLQSVPDVDSHDKKGQRRLPAADLHFAIAQIARACNDFYKRSLESENSLMRGRGYLDQSWDKAVQQLLATARDKMERGQAFIVRVGRHSGAESVTLNGVRSIKIMEGKGPDGRNRSSNASAAKTLWLAADSKDQSSGLLPFGWILVDLHPIDTPAPEWRELEDACEPGLATARNLAKKLAEQKDRLEEAKALGEMRKREEEKKARLAAESEARRQREKADRQARLAAMTAEARAISELHEWFEQDTQAKNLKPGGRVINRLNELFRQADSWPTDACCSLADLAEEIFNEPSVGWGSGDKKRERKARIESLRAKT